MDCLFCRFGRGVGRPLEQSRRLGNVEGSHYRVNPMIATNPAIRAEDVLYSEKQAAPMCGWSTATLRKKRCVGGGPDYVKMGRSVRYRLSDIRAFVAGNVVHAA